MESKYIQNAKMLIDHVQEEIKIKCSNRKIGNCHLKTCCRYSYNTNKGIWRKRERSCKSTKKCRGVIIKIQKCRNIKLINNCYKRRCLTVIFKKNKLISKKCKKSRKICIPIISTRCVKRRVKGSNCHYHHCCKNTQYKGRTISRSCLSKNKVCPTKVTFKCKTHKVKGKNCSQTKCCKKSIREGKVLANSCYNRRKRCKKVLKRFCISKKKHGCSLKKCCVKQIFNCKSKTFKKNLCDKKNHALENWNVVHTKKQKMDVSEKYAVQEEKLVEN